LAVFLCRYLDLLTLFINWYTEIMKLFYIGASAYIVYLMVFDAKFSASYNRAADSYRVEFLAIPAFILACFLNEARWNHDSWPRIGLEIFWAFSLYLEAVAILPQLKMLHQLEDTTNITRHYIVLLGVYRSFYILNWIYRWYAEGYWHWIAVIAGLVQTALYVDFFILYYQSVIMTLPGGSGSAHARWTWTSAFNKFMFGDRRK
jgi:ER lumen protein retaining receptor